MRRPAARGRPAIARRCAALLRPGIRRLGEAAAPRSCRRRRRRGSRAGRRRRDRLRGRARSAASRSPCGPAARPAGRLPRPRSDAAPARLRLRRRAKSRRTRPLSFESAPYFAAFVASSCRAMAMASAARGAGAHVRPADREARRARVAMGRERLLDDVAERGALPVLAGEHVMRLGEREQPGLEGVARLARGLARRAGSAPRSTARWQSVFFTR